MTYYDSVSRGKRREIPKERIKPLTQEWEQQIRQVRDSGFSDESEHSFFPPQKGEPTKSRIFFRRRSNADSSERPSYLFGNSENVSSVSFPSSLEPRNRSSSMSGIRRRTEEPLQKENIVERYDPRLKVNGNLRIDPKKTTQNKSIRPRVTPLRKSIQTARESRSFDPKRTNDVRPPNFYEKWKDHESPTFNRHNEKRDGKFDKKDPAFRLFHSDNYTPMKYRGKESFVDKIGEFERTLLHREAFDHSDLSVPRKFDRKDPTNRIYGLIDEKVLSRKPFNHHDNSPHPIGKHDRKDLLHRLYGYDKYPEEEEKDGGRISPRTKNTYGTLCKVRPSRMSLEEEDYQKKSLKSRLYGTPYKPVPKPRDRVDYFEKKLHNPARETDSQFRNFGNYEYKKLYRIPLDKPPRTHFRRQPRRRLYNHGEGPDFDGSLERIGKGNPKDVPKRKNLSKSLYGIDMCKMHAKDFVEYQEKMANEKYRLNQKSFFDVPIYSAKVTKKINTHNPWRRNQFLNNDSGFMNQGGKYYDAK